MKNNENLLLGILVGTALGGALGVLFAPDKGSKTRQRLVDEAATAKEYLTKNAIDFKDEVVKTAISKKQTIDEQMDTILQDASHKADDVIGVLETKLAELKNKNKNLQK